MNDYENSTYYSNQQRNLKSFLFSTKSLGKSFGRIVLMLVFLFILSSRSGSFNKDYFLFFLILFIPFFFLDEIINIIAWIVLLIKTKPGSDMTADFNSSIILFDEQAAVGREYLFLKGPHKVLLLEDCCNIKVIKLRNDTMSWLVFSVYTVNKKKPYKFIADIDPVRNDYDTFEQAMMNGNSKLISVMPGVRDKLIDLNVLELSREELEKANQIKLEREREKFEKERAIAAEKAKKVVPDIDPDKAIHLSTIYNIASKSTDFKEGKAYFNGHLILGKKYMYVPIEEAVIDYQKIIHFIIEEKVNGYRISVIIDGKSKTPSFSIANYNGVSAEIEDIKTELLTRCKKLNKETFRILKYRV